MKNPKVAITHLAIEIDTQVTDHVVAMKKIAEYHILTNCSKCSVDSRNFEMWGQLSPMSEKCGGLVNKNGNFYIRQRGVNFGSICLSVCLLRPCSTKGLSPDPVCDP